MVFDEMLFLPQKQEKMKSNFTQTCNRFSQFLKERRSLGHVDAFRNIASSENEIKGVAKDVCGSKNEMKSLELFPFISSSPVAHLECSSKNVTKSSVVPKPKEEHKNTTTPSMTIFYGGKVMIFDELPEEKAQEILSLASRGTTNSHVQFQAHTQVETPHLTRDVVSQGVKSVSDLPIARRVSLHRFMEKRKHRIATRAPYQLQSSLKTIFEKQQLELKL